MKTLNAQLLNRSTQISFLQNGNLYNIFYKNEIYIKKLEASYIYFLKLNFLETKISN